MWIASGTRVLDALDEDPQPVLDIGCRSGHCGRCRVRLLGDPAGVLPPTSEEQQTLHELNPPGSEYGGDRELRLGCQLVVTGATDTVILRCEPQRTRET